MTDKYLEFETRAEMREHLKAGGYPKRGKYRRKDAPDNKQQTERPYPIEKVGTKFVMKAESSYGRMKNAIEITKKEAQDLGAFPDPIEDI